MVRSGLVIGVLAPPDGVGLPPVVRESATRSVSAPPSDPVVGRRFLEVAPEASDTTARVTAWLHAEGPRVVLCETAAVALAAAPACLRAGVPYAVRVHGRDVTGHREVTGRCDELRWLFGRAAAVIAASRDLLPRVRSLGAGAGRSLWLPCGNDLGTAPPGAGVRAAPPHPRRVLWAGRLDACRDPGQALEVIARVRERQPDAHLVLVGDGPRRGDLAGRVAAAQAAPGPPAVTLEGEADAEALAGHMDASAALLVTSRTSYAGGHEATPVMTLLAGARGLPVVATRHGGAADAILDGVTGRLVDEGDADALADALVALLDDPAAGAALGAAAREHVRRHYDAGVCEARLRSVLASVAEGAPLRAPDLPPTDAEPPPPTDEALPSVSILIPAHDAERWVSTAIDSALAQDLPRSEIIVVDDGSRDATTTVLARYGGRIRWETAPHRGGNATRNRLLELATGDWLQFLDADDVLLPGKIRAQLVAAGRARAGLVVSPALDGYGEAVHAPVGDDPWEDLLVSRLGITSSNLFERRAVVRAGGWKTTQAASQEYELMQRLLRRGVGVAVVDEPRTVKRNVNPRSVWVRDRRSSISAAERNLEEALVWLRAEGRFGPRLQSLAARRFFRLCQWRWAQGGLAAAGVVDLERRLDPRGEWLQAGMLVWHRRVYRALAFPPLRWAFRPLYKLRMVLRERRKRLRARWSRRPSPGAASPPAGSRPATVGTPPAG